MELIKNYIAKKHPFDLDNVPPGYSRGRFQQEGWGSVLEFHVQILEDRIIRASAEPIYELGNAIPIMVATAEPQFNLKVDILLLEDQSMDFFVTRFRHNPFKFEWGMNTLSNCRFTEIDMGFFAGQPRITAWVEGSQLATKSIAKSS